MMTAQASALTLRPLRLCGELKSPYTQLKTDLRLLKQAETDYESAGARAALLLDGRLR